MDVRNKRSAEWSNWLKEVKLNNQQDGDSMEKKQEGIKAQLKKFWDIKKKIRRNAKRIKTIYVEYKVTIRKEYEQLNKQVKKTARKNTRNWMEGMAQREEEAAATNNIRELYKISDLLINQKHNNGKPLYNKEGKVLTTTEEQLKRWQEYYKGTLEEAKRGAKNKQIVQQQEENFLDIGTQKPTKKEVEQASY